MKSRWLILFLSCILLFGNYYAYDNPAALALPLQEFMNFDDYSLSLLYSAYSLPNLIFPLITGWLVDFHDNNALLLFFSILVCIGQTMFTIGLSIKSFPLMLLGRFIFGLGGESVSIVQCAITTRWFRGKELAFALGFSFIYLI